MEKGDRKDEERVMASNPFDEEEVLARTFFAPGSPDPVQGQLIHKSQSAGAGRSSHATKAVKPKPTHYKVVSISLYLDDIDRIDTLVKELKRRGFTKMNRSALIRFAIDTVDIDKLPRQY
jgi:hypothetical protein